MLTRQNILQLQNMVAYIRDEQAYKELFFHYYPVLFKFSYAICKNHEMTEEIVMDVLLRMWSMETRLAFVENLTTYLYTAINNTSFNYLKREKKFSSTNAIKEDFTNDLLDVPLKNELNDIIEQSVKRLPLQGQLVFRLIKEDGLSHKQVSVILGISQNTIESHMRSALKKLRTQLSAYLNKKN